MEPMSSMTSLITMKRRKQKPEAAKTAHAFLLAIFGHLFVIAAGEMDAKTIMASVTVAGADDAWALVSRRRLT